MFIRREKEGKDIAKKMIAELFVTESWLTNTFSVAAKYAPMSITRTHRDAEGKLVPAVLK